MKQYLELVRHVLDTGKRKSDPQKVGNIAVCGYQMRFDLDDGFPLITTKSLKNSWRAIVEELLWFLSGSTMVADLNARGVHIWDQWATPEICRQMGLPEGDLGPIYGKQWRAFDGGYAESIDQIQVLIDGIIKNPDSRRHKVTAWNPADIDKVFVAPCHGDFVIFHAAGELTLHITQRSADVAIGVPFNIASYALLLMMIAQATGFKAKELVHELVDAHIYLNQIDAIKEQLNRRPSPLPKVKINPNVKSLFEFRFEDFTLTDYDPHPFIKMAVAL